MAVKRKKSPPEIPPITQPHDLLSGSVPVADTEPTSQHQAKMNLLQTRTQKHRMVLSDNSGLQV